MRLTVAVRTSSLSSLARPALNQPSGSPQYSFYQEIYNLFQVRFYQQQLQINYYDSALTIARCVPIVLSSAGGISTQLVGQQTISAPISFKIRQFSKAPHIKTNKHRNTSNGSFKHLIYPRSPGPKKTLYRHTISVIFYVYQYNHQLR